MCRLWALLLKYSIKGAKYICLKAGCKQGAYGINNMQCRQSQLKTTKAPSLFTLTRILKDAMKQQPEYKSHQNIFTVCQVSYHVFFLAHQSFIKQYGLENVYNIKCTLKRHVPYRINIV